LIDELIAGHARKEFARSMRFEGGGVPRIPPCTANKPRLMYIHIPFCEQLCPYCSFNRVVFDETLCRSYYQALRREIMLYEASGYSFSGIYVGGGTPTVLIDELEETLTLARTVFPVVEISVETNPNHLTPDRLEVLKRVGVNRLSVGVQSFEDRLLKDMDRYHKYGSGREIAERLKATMGLFDTLNADMIFNFPSQQSDMLARDLDVLVELGIDQITYYPLMVSNSTRQIISKTLGEVDYSKEKALYKQIVKRLRDLYRFSSAWCFSRKTGMIDEYVVHYDEYAGLGSGSIGFLSGTCYANTFNIQAYISQVMQGEGQFPLMASRNFSAGDLLRYDFLMKLFGMTMNTEALAVKYGGGVLRHLWFEILAFMAVGGLRYRKPHLYLTERGRYMWVIMMREFFIAVNNFRDYCRPGMERGGGVAEGNRVR
jgi:coproporphyrinogen III oxidase-like Fe-S oxidoreductase